MCWNDNSHYNEGLVRTGWRKLTKFIFFLLCLTIAEKLFVMFLFGVKIGLIFMLI